MIVSKEFPDRQFETKEDLFKALLENEIRIISLKTADTQKSFEKGQLGTFQLFKVSEQSKSALKLKDDHIYAVINTTKYMDGHGDVHFDGIWNKSLKEQQGKLFYVADHSLNIHSVIAWPEDVKAMTKMIPWAFVGKDYEGETEALIYEIAKDKIVSESAKNIISEKRPVQNSVRMRYIKVKMAINSEEKDYVTHKAYYDSRIAEIANKEDVESQGYFFGVEEAQISKEGSMVLFGSNDATLMIHSEAEQITTGKTEPIHITQTDEKKEYNFNPNLI